MANWLGLAGGAAEGVLAGMQDNRQRELYNMYMRQQKREEEQRLAEDAAAAEVSARIKSAEAPQADMSGKGMTAGSLDQGDWPTTRAKVSPSQRLGIVADVQTASKVPKLQLQGAQLAAQAEQLKGVERTGRQDEQREALFAKYKALIPTITADPGKFLKEQGASYYNGKVPDGFDVAYADQPDGGVAYSFIDQKTGKPSGYKSIPKERLHGAAMDVAERMLHSELGTISTADFREMGKYKQTEQELGIKRTTADAAMRNAATNEAHYGPGGTYETAMREANEARLKAAQIGANARTPAEKAAVLEYKDYKDTLDKYMLALQDPIKNKTEVARLTTHLSAYHPNKVQTPMRVGTDKDGNPTYAMVNRMQELTKEAYRNFGYNTLEDGTPLPKKMTEKQFIDAQAEAKKNKVNAGVFIVDNEPVIGYVNPALPNERFDTIKEAKTAPETAKKAEKEAQRAASSKAIKEGKREPEAPVDPAIAKRAYRQLGITPLATRIGDVWNAPDSGATLTDEQRRRLEAAQRQ